MSAFFMSPTLREDLQRRLETTASMPSVKVVEELGTYWGLLPLDKRIPDPPKYDAQGRLIPGTAGIYGYRTWVYKATNEADGKVYALRRIEGFRVSNEQAIQMVEKWSRIRHPNLVGVREAFTTRAFGDHCEPQYITS